ncbi:MAG: hypothetical protein ABJN14_08705 [Paracoccaceae bacterium]
MIKLHTSTHRDIDQKDSVAHKAIAILQSMLDHQSDCLMARDWDGLHDTFSLPYKRVFINSETIIETRKDTQIGHTSFLNSLESLGVNQFIRLATDAEFLGKDYIEGFYVSHVLRGTVPMVPSYNNRLVLKRTNETWCIIEIESSIVVPQWPPDLSIKPTATIAPHLGSKNDVRRSLAEPLSLYQAFLDAYGQTITDKKFDAFCALYCFPCSYHSLTKDLIVKGPEDLTQVFDDLSGSYDGRRGDNLVRTADRAEFLQADLICGYHTARVYRNGKQSAPPLKSRMLLKRHNTEWRLVSVTNALDDDSYSLETPRPNNQLPTLREIQERTKSWPTSL